jgi:O-antigen/teichoic acid export membrane protein
MSTSDASTVLVASAAVAPRAAIDVGPQVAAPTLKQRALQATTWSAFGYVSSQVLRLGSNMVLARLLFPEAFGLMAMIQIYMQGLQMFSDIGIGPAIIQSKRAGDPVFLNTAWTMQAVRGLSLWVGAVVLSWPMAWFYGERHLAWLIPVSSLTAVISGLNSTSLFTENRRLALARVTVLTLSAQVASLVVMIIGAYLTRSVWSLVVGGLVNSLLIMVLSHAILPGTRNRFCWDAEARRSLLSFGKWIFASTMVTFLAMQLDRLVLGKLVPMELLGVYSLALLVVSFPQRVASRLATSILYPVFVSQAQRQHEKGFTVKVVQAREAVLPPCVVAFLAIALGAPIVFRYCYDPRYAAAGWMAQMLSIYTWFLLLKESVDRALLALGDSRAMWLGNAVNVVVTVAGCIAGFRFFGMPGFILGLGASSVAGHLVTQICLLRHGINIIWQDARFTALAGALCAVGIAGPKVAEASFGAQAGVLALWLCSTAAVGGAGVWALVVVARRARA